MTLRKKLPSPQSLFAFEAAARMLNFTDAGKQLNVTQPAISKNIAKLETHLGTRLFVRKKSGLMLTPDGDILYRAVRSSFEAVEGAIDQISYSPMQKNALRVSFSTAFTAHWLMPQMPEFQNEFPDVRLSFELAGGEMKGALEACDLGLRHETNVAPQDHAVAVVPEWIVAVASPEYIKRQGMLDAPLSDNTHSLVTLVDARISWQFFFDETSQHPEKRLPEIQVPDYSVVLQAALNGRGVALGYVSTCSYLLRKGLLVPAMTKTLKTNKHYCVVTKGNSCISPLATQVEKWISQRYDEIIEELATIIGR